MVTFATCDKQAGLRFLKVLYPSKNVTLEKVSKLMLLLDKDILRIQDPMMHTPAQIIAGHKYKKENSGEIQEAIKQLKKNLH